MYVYTVLHHRCICITKALHSKNCLQLYVVQCPLVYVCIQYHRSTNLTHSGWIAIGWVWFLDLQFIVYMGFKHYASSSSVSQVALPLTTSATICLDAYNGLWIWRSLWIYSIHWPCLYSNLTTFVKTFLNMRLSIFYPCQLLLSPLLLLSCAVIHNLFAVSWNSLQSLYSIYFWCII